jgi:hypothetical protein
MRPDVAQLVYRLPVELRPVVTAEVRSLKTADQAAHIAQSYSGLLAERVDIDAYLADDKRRKAAAAHGHRGGVKTARKRRLGWVPAADPAGARWKPDFSSPLNKAVFPAYVKLPVYIPPLVPAMSPLVAKTVIIIGDVVDHLGDFVLPRATHAQRIGASERKAYAALQTMKAAGLLRVRLPGDRTQATVWSYAPVAAVDIAKARKVLRGSRRQASERARKAFSS